MSIIEYFFFFFQAEDGIRDDLVTGVQTCALPICACANAPPAAVNSKAVANFPSFITPPHAFVIGRMMPGFSVSGYAGLRSEERRVGKECRYRWSPYNYIKKRNKDM